MSVGGYPQEGDADTLAQLESDRCGREEGEQKNIITIDVRQGRGGGGEGFQYPGITIQREKRWARPRWKVKKKRGGD